MNDPSIPDTIGPYRILRRLGRGGMGEVFLAHDPRLDREVAIKRLIGIDETRRGRFRREARLAAGLNHPAIVQVFDLLNENGNEHIVMEYVPGTTLRAYAERSQVPLAEMLAICAEIAEALAYAHRRGVIHRDLKTENVLLTEDRRPKIADFGIARRDDTDGIDTSGFTATGALIGTARIMSPEQARGETIDLRSDVFSFGVLIYEVMTSTSPFLGANEVATVVRVISERHLPLIDAAPNMPRDLSRLVDELMAKDPDQRPSDVATLAPRLRALAQEASGLLVGGAKRRAAPPSVVTPPPPAAVVVPATDEPPTDAFQATGRRTAEGRATGPRLTRNQDTAAYASEPTSMPAAPSWSPSFTGSGTPAATAERRQVTILCCDLLDTSGDPDPETLFEAMPAFQELAKASIDRYDGRLASVVDRLRGRGDSRSRRSGDDRQSWPDDRRSGRYWLWRAPGTRASP
ncbi:MAG: serine/threonine-protein kinase, partial [Acidobacteriota bacterium]